MDSRCRQVRGDVPPVISYQNVVRPASGKPAARLRALLRKATYRPSWLMTGPGRVVVPRLHAVGAQAHQHRRLRREVSAKNIVSAGVGNHVARRQVGRRAEENDVAPVGADHGRHGVASQRATSILPDADQDVAAAPAVADKNILRVVRVVGDQIIRVAGKGHPAPVRADRKRTFRTQSVARPYQHGRNCFAKSIASSPPIASRKNTSFAPLISNGTSAPSGPEKAMNWPLLLTLGNIPVKSVEPTPLVSTSASSWCPQPYHAGKYAKPLETALAVKSPALLRNTT